MHSPFSQINSRLRLEIGCLLLLLLPLSACSGLSFGTSSPTPTPTSAPIHVAAQPTIPALPTGIPSALPTSIPANLLLTQNLIVNGNAEVGPGAPNENTIEPIPGWTRHGSIDVIQYGTSGSYISTTDPGPSNRGENYFYGGGDNIANYGDNTTTSLTQTINVSLASVLISQGHIQFTLSGWLGGYSDQGDYAQLTMQFVSSTGQKLSTASIGPVLAADRHQQSGLVLRSATGLVPAATAAIQVTLTMTKRRAAITMALPIISPCSSTFNKPGW